VKNPDQASVLRVSQFAAHVEDALEDRDDAQHREDVDRRLEQLEVAQ
jgi:hypothetical protein